MKNNNIYWIIGIIILGLFLYNEGYLQSIIQTNDGFILIGDSNTELTNKTLISGTPVVFTVSNDYSYCSGGPASFDSKYWEWIERTSFGCNSAYHATVGTGSDLDFTYSQNWNPGTSSGNPCSSNPAEAKAKLKFNLKGKNFRAEYSYNAPCSYLKYVGNTYCADGSVNTCIYLSTNSEGDLPIFCKSSQIPLETGLLEITPSFLNPDEVTVYYKGLFVKSMNITSSEYYLMLSPPGAQKIGSQQQIINPRYQPLLSCQMSGTDMVAFESFSGGKQISLIKQEGISTPRFPVKSFCLAQPAIITDATTNSSGSNAEIYQKLIQGETLTIPEGQTWSLFYTFDNSQNLVPSACALKEYYNTATNNCQSNIGVVTLCSEGVFDPSIGACVVTQETICPDGRLEIDRDNMSLSKCVYNPPVEQKCLDPKAIYNPSSNACEYYVESTCPEGLKWDGEKCVGLPPVELKGGITTIIKQNWWFILIIIALIGVIIWNIKRKK